jgi:hypothetical protein
MRYCAVSPAHSDTGSAGLFIEFLDFNDRARSAIIDGGPWEVCVGTNFHNGCTVLASGRYPSLGKWVAPDQLGAAAIVAVGKPATVGRSVAGWRRDIL